MLAKINGLFRLTRDAELRYTNDGNPVLKIGIVSSEKYQDKETQLFLDAAVFGKQAEILNQYAGSKGTQIYLSGKLKTDSWVDNNTQQKRSKTVMIVEGFDFVSGQGNNQPNNNQANQGYSQPQQPAQQQSYQQPQPQGYQQPQQQQQAQQMPQQQQAINMDEDEIPF